MGFADTEACGLPLANASVATRVLLQRFAHGPQDKTAWSRQQDWAQVLLAQYMRATTAQPNSSSAAAVEGVAANQEGDLAIFLVSLATNCGVVTLAVLALSLFRVLLPLVYQRSKSRDLSSAAEDAGLKSRRRREMPQRSCTGCEWLMKSWNASTEEVADVAGLDAAMHCEFLDLGMRLCMMVGFPCFVVLCPLHFLLGGDAAGADQLSKLGMANVMHGSWLCWLHAFFVWYVVVITHAQVHLAQSRFMPLRMRWLQTSPVPNATTVLVRGIPETLLTGDALRRFFDDGVFGYQAVKRIEFIKDTGELLYWKNVADTGQGSWRTGTGRVLQGQELQAVAASTVDTRRKQLIRSSDRNSSNAFVTFHEQREAVVAQKLLAEEDNDGIRAEAAPDPGEVLWSDLLLDPGSQAIKELIGYFLIFLVFWGFMPLVVFIQSIANLHTLENIQFFKTLVDNFPALATLWNGLMASFALSVAMSFLPSMLMAIFAYFFVFTVPWQP